MSNPLLNAAMEGGQTPQYPMDDFFSFFFVTLWATIFNSQEF
jgi:hypothetical protein